MRKKALLASAALALTFTGCKETAYTVFEDNNIHVEYPKTWEMTTELEGQPFAAFGEVMFAAVRTRAIDSVPEELRSLDDFSQFYVGRLKEGVIQFKLDKVEDGDGYKTIYFSSGSKQNESYQDEMAKLFKGKKFFYAIECAAKTKEEKDTMEHIVKSFCLK